MPKVAHLVNGKAEGPRDCVLTMMLFSSPFPAVSKVHDPSAEGLPRLHSASLELISFFIKP